MRRALLLAGAAVALSGCSLAGDLTPPPALATAQAEGLGFPPTAVPAILPARPPDVAAGGAIYVEKCAPCHGETGDGDGVQAGELPNPPTAFTAPEAAQRAIPEAWFNVVTEGRFDRFMPGFSSLDDDQRWDVVGYALSLGLPAEAVETGRDLFAETCAECHAADGSGVGDVVDLTTLELQSTRSWLALYGAITNGSGEGMPAYADSLSEDQRWALAAYVRSLGLDRGATPAATLEPTIVSTAESTAPSEANPTPTSTPEPVGVTIGCRVENGTDGSVPAAGLEVTLHGFDGDQEALTRTATTDAAGRCVFESIEQAPDRKFVVTTSYQDVLYASEILELAEDSPNAELPVLVFEATSDAGSVLVSRLHLLFEVPADGVLQVVELWLLSNPGDQTIYDAERGALEVVLPEGASGLSLDGGVVGDRFELTEDGFRDRRALVPGENTGELVFSYNLPYGRRMEFARPVAYPVAAVVALTAAEGPTISGEGLVEGESRSVSGTELKSYELPAVEAGGEIRLNLRGGSAGGATATVDPTTIALGVAGLALAAIGAVLLWRKPRKAVTATPAATDDETILWAIASLDNELAAGRLTAEEHRARRADLLRRLESDSP